MDGGKISESGTYDELMSKNGVFAELVKRQQINAELICYDCGHYLHYYKSEEMSSAIMSFMKSIS